MGMLNALCILVILPPPILQACTTTSSKPSLAMSRRGSCILQIWIIFIREGSICGILHFFVVLGKESVIDLHLRRLQSKTSNKLLENMSELFEAGIAIS